MKIVIKRIGLYKVVCFTLLSIALVTNCDNSLPGWSNRDPVFLRDILDTTFTVDADDYVHFPFQVTEEEIVHVVELWGDFTASGGSDDCIEVFILDEENLLKADSGRPFSPNFFSGRVASGEIRIDIFDPILYYLVYSNTFCDTADKVVTTKVYLQNYGD